MALGGTAVEFEKPLNFYAGWRKHFIIQIFLFYVFQIRIIQFLSILLFSFGALVFSVRDKNELDNEKVDQLNIGFSEQIDTPGKHTYFASGKVIFILNIF